MPFLPFPEMWRPNLVGNHHRRLFVVFFRCQPSLAGAVRIRVTALECVSGSRGEPAARAVPQSASHLTSHRRAKRAIRAESLSSVLPVWPERDNVKLPRVVSCARHVLPFPYLLPVRPRDDGVPWRFDRQTIAPLDRWRVRRALMRGEGYKFLAVMFSEIRTCICINAIITRPEAVPPRPV